ncbi:MAG: MSMEG_1061 family FMN-dependent PPOX-type flavoprotein [Mycobacteriales bacterium]
MHEVTSAEALLALYGEVSERAAGKVHPALDEHDRRFIAHSPFLVLATSGPMLDVSPRGDLPGFVEVLDDGRLLLPDRPGNNRVDSLFNVVADPRVALFFLVPGIGHTLRVNGTAVVSTDPALLALGEVRGRLPTTTMVVTPVEVLYQCPRAVTRAGLWEAHRHVDPAALATLDEVLADQVDGLTLERSLALGKAGLSKPLW